MKQFENINLSENVFKCMFKPHLYTLHGNPGKLRRRSKKISQTAEFLFIFCCMRFICSLGFTEKPRGLSRL